MRKVFSVALMAAMVCLVGMAKDASALVTFNLIWTSTSGTGVVGTNAIDVDPGDVVILTVRMTTDQTLAGHGVSLNFDTDLGNELNLFNPAGGKEWAGTTYGVVAMPSFGTYAPLVLGLGPPPAVDSTGGSSGRINTFESAKGVSGAYLPVGTYAVGTARFVATGSAATDGADIFSGLFNFGVDDVLNNLNAVIPSSGLVFGSASINVNVIPEPGTASLLGLGLLGLVLAGRRSRR